MNPNDPLNNVPGQNPTPQDSTQPTGAMPTPDAAQSAPQDWSQPQTTQPDPTAMPQSGAVPTPDWSQPAQPDPVQPMSAPVMGGDMSGGAMPSPAAIPTPDAGTPGQMPSSQMPGQPMMGGMPPMSGPDDKKRRIVMVAVLLLALVALVVGSWFVVKAYQKNHDKNTTNNAAKKSTSSTSAPDINTLASFTLQQPPASKLSGYTVSAGSTAGETTISAPVGTDTNDACVISYGVFSQADLPGTDIGDVVAKETVLLKNNGVTVSGPNVIKALVLKNASTSATYSIPSVSFSYTKDSVTEVANYSISELKDQSHVAVLQVCAGKDTAANLTSKLNSELVPVAAEITVKTN